MQPTAIHPVVRGIVEGGLRVTGVDTFKGMYALQSHLRDAEELFAQIDVLLLPRHRRSIA